MQPEEKIVINGRIPSIDGFRMISILLVLLSHIGFITKLPGNLNEILRTWNYAELGVRIFFVISGFIITYLLLAENANYGKIDLKAFYYRRIFRIFPVYYAYLLVLFLINQPLELAIPYQNFISSGLFFQNFDPWLTDWLVGHSWSLAVEEQFYLIWPLAFAFILKFKKIRTWKLILIGVSIAGICARSLHHKYPDLSGYVLAPFLKHADFLFTGCFIAYLVFNYYKQLEQYFTRINPVCLYLAIGTTLLVSWASLLPEYKVYLLPFSGAVVAFSIGFAFLYLIFRKESVGFKILNTKGAVFIGKLSFSLYIWQQLFLSAIGYWFTLFPQNIILVWIVACISYYFIEMPFVRIRNRFRPGKLE